MTEQTTPQVEAATPKPVTLDSVKTDFPDIAAALTAEGATAERSRIEGIEAVALPGHDDLVASFKADGVSVADAAIQIAAAEKAKGVSHMASLTEAITTVPITEADASVAGAVIVNSSLPVEERCKLAWDKDADLRSQFMSFDHYVAEQKASDSGLVKSLKQRT